jgi:hypothetical protein
MDDATLHAALRYFPLVGRPRPACGPLTRRIAEVTAIATAACQPGADVLREAAHALNKAALAASDCGLPDLARVLCWSHISAYQVTDRRLTVKEARGILEPTLNLARLAIRARQPHAALKLLGDIHQAITTSTDLVIDGSLVPVGGITGTRDEHRKLREWAWLQHLSEGIRAHVLAGQWDEAAAHAERHRGIGAHLMEGRQAAIIASRLNGDARTARQMLAETTVTEPWERQVAACLAVMCADGDEPEHELITAMADGFAAPEPVPGYAAYRARLGATVTTLASAADPAKARLMADAVACEAITSADGYAARDVLASPETRDLVRASQRQRLIDIKTASGIGTGSIPGPLCRDLVLAVSKAEALLCGLLSAYPTVTG